MEILIDATGQGRCLYAEHIDLTTLGKLAIRRGSHVESTPDARWTACSTCRGTGPAWSRRPT